MNGRNSYTGHLNKIIERLEREAYVLECCDTTNDYAEAQLIRKLISDLKRLDATSRPAE